MKRLVRVESYFSLPTDLAAEMRHLPEYVDGSGYNVQLGTPTESVSIRFVDAPDAPFLLIEGVGKGSLFDRVLGRAIYALAANSDTVCLHRVRQDVT